MRGNGRKLPHVLVEIQELQFAGELPALHASGSGSSLRRMLRTLRSGMVNTPVFSPVAPPPQLPRIKNGQFYKKHKFAAVSETQKA